MGDGRVAGMDEQVADADFDRDRSTRAALVCHAAGDVEGFLDAFEALERNSGSPIPVLLHYLLHLLSQDAEGAKPHREHLVETLLPGLQAQAPWEAQVLVFLDGRIDASALYAAAGEDAGRLCCAHYHVGARLLAQRRIFDDESVQALRLAMRADVSRHEGWLAFVALSRVVVEADTPGLPPTGRRALFHHDRAALRRGEFEDPLQFFGAFLEKVFAAQQPSLQDLGTAAFALQHAGWLSERRGEADSAYACLRDAAALVRSHPLEDWRQRAGVLCDFGRLCFEQARWQESRDAFCDLLDLVASEVPEPDCSLGDQLNAAALAAERLGDHAEALRWLQRAMEIEAAAGADGLLARTLDHLGGVRESMGDQAAALECYERAERIFRAMGERGWFDLSVNRLRASTVLRASGRLDDAVAAARECVDLRRRTRTPFDARLAHACVRLGKMLVEQQRYAEALPLLEHARQVVESVRAERRADHLELLNELLIGYALTYDRARVLEVAGQISGACETLAATHAELAARTLANAASALRQVDEVGDGVLVLARNAVALLDGDEPLSAECRVHVLSSAGSTLTSVGDYAAAARLLRQAQAAADEPAFRQMALGRNAHDRIPLHLLPSYELALLYRQSGQAARAEQLLRRMDEDGGFAPRGDFACELQRELAAAVYQQYRPQHAGHLLTLALNMVPRDDLDMRRRILADLANVHSTLGNPAQALTHADEVRVLMAELSVGGRELVMLLLNRAHMQLALGALDAAMNELGEAQALLEKVDPRDGGPARLLCGLKARLLLMRGDARAALASALQAVEVDAAWIERVSAVASEARRLEAIRDAQERLELLVACLVADAVPEDGTVQTVAERVLQAKGRAMELSVREVTALRQARAPHLQARLWRLGGLRAQAAEMALLRLEGAAAVARRDAVAREIDEIESELALELDAIGVQRAGRQAGCAAVAARLDEGAVLVDWLHVRGRSDADARYVAFVHRGGSPASVSCVALPTPAPDIDALILDWRAWLEAEQGLPAAGAADTHEIELARRLGEALLGPLGVDPARTRCVVICADGKLAELPFAALVLDEAGTRLLQACEVQWVDTPRDLLRFDGMLRPAAPAVVAGAPCFEWSASAVLPQDAAGDEFSPQAGFRDGWDGGRWLEPLPHAGEEAQGIAHRLGVQAWTGAQVLKSRLLALRSPQVLHLATHALRVKDAHAGMPALAQVALALSGAQTFLQGREVAPECGNGLLSGIEARQLDLSGCQLCVLSACSTGMGDHVSGEGVFSLARAFHLAGARAVIASQWSQSDAASRAFMDEVYERLLEGGDPVQAVRRTQLSFLRHPRFAHPFYWAGWYLLGDRSALAEAPVLAAQEETAAPQPGHAARLPPAGADEGGPPQEAGEPPAAASPAFDTVFAHALARRNAGFMEHAVQLLANYTGPLAEHEARRRTAALAQMLVVLDRAHEIDAAALEDAARGGDETALSALFALGSLAEAAGDHALRGEHARRARELGLQLCAQKGFRIEGAIEPWLELAEAMRDAGDRRAGSAEALAALLWAIGQPDPEGAAGYVARLVDVLDDPRDQASAAQALAAIDEQRLPVRLRQQWLQARAMLEGALGRAGLATELAQRTLVLAVEKFGPYSAQAAAALHQHGLHLADAGRHAEAVEVLVRCADVLERSLRDKGSNYLATMRLLAAEQQAVGAIDDARATLAKALAPQRHARALDAQGLFEVTQAALLLGQVAGAAAGAEALYALLPPPAADPPGDSGVARLLRAAGELLVDSPAEVVDGWRDRVARIADHLLLMLAAHPAHCGLHCIDAGLTLNRLCHRQADRVRADALLAATASALETATAVERRGFLQIKWRFVEILSLQDAGDSRAVDRARALHDEVAAGAVVDEQERSAVLTRLRQIIDTTSTQEAP